MKNQKTSSTDGMKESVIFKSPKEYSHKTKQEFKEKALSMFNIKKGRKNMLIGFSLTQEDSKHNYCFEQLMEGISHLPVNVLVIGKKKNHYLDYKNIRYVASTKKNTQIVQASTDIFLLPETFNFENECLSFGTTSIYLNSQHYSGHLRPYKPLEEQGNGIECNKDNHWIIFASIIRALETYKFSYDWKTLCKNAFETGQGV